MLESAQIVNGPCVYAQGACDGEPGGSGFWWCLGRVEIYLLGWRRNLAFLAFVNGVAL